MDQISLSKKQIISIASLLLLVVALPVALYLTRQTQIFRPKAAEEQIQFFGRSPECTDCGETQSLTGGRVGFTLNPQGEAKVGIRLTSPLGPPSGISPTPSPSPALSPTVSPSPTRSPSPTPSPTP